MNNPHDLISREATLDAIFGCFNIMESKGIDMTVAKTIVKGVLDGVPAIDAIPIEWIQAQRTENPQTVVEFARNIAYRTVLYGWKAEQEEQDG